MQFDQSFPFYMPYPIWMPFEQEREQEKDREVMKSYYSRRAAMIQWNGNVIGWNMTGV